MKTAPSTTCLPPLARAASCLLLSALFWAIPGALVAQGATRAQVEQVDAIFAGWSDASGPGASVAVTRNGRVIYSQGYGSAQLEYAIPITPATVFHVASVSKQFTAFAVALLARDGLLGWDDLLHTHLPELPDLGQPITLRQLANHTSGIRDQWELLIMAGWRIDDVITQEHVLRMMSRQRELNFPPQSEYLYSNMGYSLLAEVVERVSGTSFGAFLEERVFLPLGMHRTHVHLDHTRVVPNRAYSYAPQPGGGWRNAVLSYANQGATSLFTTAEDLARWMGEMEEPVVGDVALWREMSESAVLTDGGATGYGLGLSVAPYRGLRAQGHGGADAGFRSNLLHFPDEGVGVVVLGNAGSFNAAAMARSVAAVFLEERMEPDVANVLEPRPRVALQPSLLDELSGRYRVGGGTTILVRREGEGLLADPDGEVFELIPESETDFWVPSMKGRLSFQREGDGRLEGFVLEHPEGVERGRRVPVEDFSGEDLAVYTGAYYSPELDAMYRLRIQGGALVAEPPRQPAIELFPLDSDRFGGSSWGLSTLVFSRNTAGEVDGFRATGGRVRNLRFERVSEPSW